MFDIYSGNRMSAQATVEIPLGSSYEYENQPKTLDASKALACFVKESGCTMYATVMSAYSGDRAAFRVILESGELKDDRLKTVWKTKARNVISDFEREIGNSANSLIFFSDGESCRTEFDYERSGRCVLI